MIEKKAFPSFHFLTCGKNGMTGPSQDDANKCYQGTSVSVQIVGSGTQKWIVLISGLYIITAAGASGIQCGTSGNGKGVIISSYFRLNKNDILYILVGQQGNGPGSYWGGSGGGASYIAKKVSFSNYSLVSENVFVEPLLIAAGGGGSGRCGTNQAYDGEDGHCESNVEGGGTTVQTQASGGAGFLSDSSNGRTKSFLNGGYATNIVDSDTRVGYGGFGGGGNPFDSGGGGGGFRGGNSNEFGVRGDGGYSYNNGLSISCSAVNIGIGYVVMQFVRGALTCKRTRNQNITYFIYIFIISS